jgi:hypothetical protein
MFGTLIKDTGLERIERTMVSSPYQQQKNDNKSMNMNGMIIDLVVVVVANTLSSKRHLILVLLRRYIHEYIDDQKLYGLDMLNISFITSIIIHKLYHHVDIHPCILSV